MGAEIVNEAKDEAVRKRFEEIFGYYTPPMACPIIHAPGRVNLIGEHIDYNDGCVMPIAISKYTSVLAVPTNKDVVRVFSENMQEMAQWDIKDDQKIPERHWANYVKGVFVGFTANGLEPQGFDIYVSSDIPFGSGLSSSAALEVACAHALKQYAALPFSDFWLAKLCMKAEHDFAGVECGLMDQVSSIFSREDHVLFFDTHFNTKQHPPFLEDCAILIVDSGMRRKLSDSRYNDRRAECDETLRLIREHVGPVKVRSWRDVSRGLLLELENALPPRNFKRASHIVSEMERVHQARQALLVQAPIWFGALMNKSHESLRYDFGVSIQELDRLCELLSPMSGVYGARLTGAGFGGCVIALVNQDAAQEIEREIKIKYKAAVGINPWCMTTRPASGVLELLNKGS